MTIECKCGNMFTSKSIPCPDNIEGCMVAHFDKDSGVCPKCGYNSGPDIADAIISGRVIQAVGMAIMNSKLVDKIEFKI
jgi:hypothetical protein